MSEPQTPGPAPKSRRGLVAYVMLVILVVPFALLAAGTGAFLGMSVAIAGWGPNHAAKDADQPGQLLVQNRRQELLGTGAVAGAGTGVGLVVVWAIVFVVCAKEPKVAPMVHALKVAAFVQDMTERGMDPKMASPILFQLVWMLGFQTPPPLFLGFWGNFSWVAGLFGAVSASAAAVYWWEHPNSPLWVIWATALIFVLSLAVGLGVVAGVYTRRLGRQYQLPAWDQYTPPSVSEVPPTIPHDGIS